MLCVLSLNVVGCKKEESFTVTFSGGHEDASLYYGEEVQVVTNANQLVEPVYVREGYNFVGWNLTVSRIEKSTTVVAQWRKYDLEVVFYANGGKDTSGNRVVKVKADSAKQLIEMQPQFERKGYTLSWVPQLETITSSCTVNAIWTINDYSITFKDKDGKDFTNNTLDVTYNDTFDYSNISAPEVSGMKFAYWADEQGFSFDNYLIMDILCL